MWVDGNTFQCCLEPLFPLVLLRESCLYTSQTMSTRFVNSSCLVMNGLNTTSMYSWNVRAVSGIRHHLNGYCSIEDCCIKNWRLVSLSDIDFLDTSLSRLFDLPWGHHFVQVQVAMVDSRTWKSHQDFHLCIGKQCRGEKKVHSDFSMPIPGTLSFVTDVLFELLNRHRLFFLIVSVIGLDLSISLSCTKLSYCDFPSWVIVLFHQLHCSWHL